ncbi:hypothetical protein AVEN_174040-1 [Araneus ventricosus]|uniref:Uncharacterized protein n=1 Tax=Araneus ventricosus TaxID=182803 RepID=A0A4Y2C398_ARAVE|nr:hypothetical protein AVEN_174040-1 [Araneus ventricosus]
MRYDCFNELAGHASSTILLSNLPPTTEAAHQHCCTTFHQVQTWQEECLNPSNWGWKLVNKSLTPIYTIKGPRPAKIVSLITCGCNEGCGKNAKVSELTCVVQLSARTAEAKVALLPKQLTFSKKKTKKITISSK